MVSFDQVKYKKRFSEKKCTDRQYHVQHNADVAHKDVINYCNTNKCAALTFCCPYYKPHRARGMIKHHHMSFDIKLGNGVCAILSLPCACVACTSMVNKPWISGIASNKQDHYKPVTKYTYWPVLGTFKNWSIIQ